MTTVKVVKQCLERIAPLRLAEKWDNVSLSSSLAIKLTNGKV
jgi:hypothetical protein